MVLPGLTWPSASASRQVQERDHAGGPAPAWDEQQPVSTEARPWTALGRKQSPRRCAGERRNVARTSRGRLRSPRRTGSQQIRGRSPAGSEAPSESTSPEGRPTRCSASPVGPVFCLPRRPKALETASYRKAAAFEHIIRRLDRKLKCLFCRSFRADARTRTEDPFITSYGPLSLSVTKSPQVTRYAGSPGLEMTHDDWR